MSGIMTEKKSEWKDTVVFTDWSQTNYFCKSFVQANSLQKPQPGRQKEPMQMKTQELRIL